MVGEDHAGYVKRDACCEAREFTSSQLSSCSFLTTSGYLDVRLGRLSSNMTKSPSCRSAMLPLLTINPAITNEGGPYNVVVPTCRQG